MHDERGFFDVPADALVFALVFVCLASCVLALTLVAVEPCLAEQYDSCFAASSISFSLFAYSFVTFVTFRLVFRSLPRAISFQ